MITLFCSPRNIGFDPAIGMNVVGLPTALNGMSFTLPQDGCGLISDTNEAPSLNLCIWQANLTQEQLDSLNANPECYVFSTFRLQQGDTSGFVQWLKSMGVKRNQFNAEFAKMRFKPEHANIAALGPAVAGGLDV